MILIYFTHLQKSRKLMIRFILSVLVTIAITKLCRFSLKNFLNKIVDLQS